MRDSDGRRTSNRLKTALVIYGLTVVAFIVGVTLMAAGVESWGSAALVGVGIGAAVSAVMTIKRRPQP